MRRIRPLGSDQDLAFDARIIAATNVDLLQLAQRGEFREDLYYRLAVITINTPSLRDRKEDVAVLIKYFLDEHMTLSGLEPVAISRGAMERLLRHDWPGNIRELRNCVTRSLAFADSDVLLAQHILFDERTTEPEPNALLPTESATQLPLPPPLPKGLNTAAPNDTASPVQVPDQSVELNPRQRQAWPVIARAGVISRSDYQEAVGGEISVRTAQYDLHDLVAKGLLKKSGRGPSSRYLLTHPFVL